MVTDFCSKHLERNTQAFADPRLTLINDDARTQLEQAPDGSFDVVIGDLADPLDGGPCYQLYTQVGPRGLGGGAVTHRAAGGGATESTPPHMGGRPVPAASTCRRCCCLLPRRSFTATWC